MDKKLTDSEIKEVFDMVKAKTDQYCQECPYDDIKVCNICIFGKMKIVIDLINRLQAKNEAYKYYYDECLKDLKKANTENERLKEVNTKLMTDFNGLSGLIHRVKAEAYKECIEKAKEIIPAIDDSYIESMVEEHFGDILKEIIGEDK